MTTYVNVNLTPQATPPWKGDLTLDGKNYQGVVTWNFAGQRYYLSLFDSNHNLVWHGAMVGSPLDYDIYIAQGVFKSSTILYRADTGNLEIEP